MKNSKKIALKNVFLKVRKDCQSVTGSNLRRIMMLVGKLHIDDLDKSDADTFSYCSVPDSEKWRLDVVNELTEIKYGECVLEGFSMDEVQEMLSDVCIN